MASILSLRGRGQGSGQHIQLGIGDSISQIRKSNKEVNIQWVPAHLKSSENEEANRLARLATVPGITAPVTPQLRSVVRQSL